MRCGPETRTARVPAEPNADGSTESPAIVSAAEDGKLRATTLAQFALKGHAVYELADGGFLVSRWGMSRHCPSLHALILFGRQVGIRT